MIELYFGSLLILLKFRTKAKKNPGRQSWPLLSDKASILLGGCNFFVVAKSLSDSVGIWDTELDSLFIV